MEPVHAKALTWIAVAAFAAALIALGQLPSWEWMRAVSVPVLAVTSAYWIFDRWAWRWPLVHTCLGKKPNLNGTWKANIASTWKAHASDGMTERFATITIWQSFSSLTFALESEESRGTLVGSELLRNPDGMYRLCGVYLNEPKPEFRERSQIHFGTFLLHIKGEARTPEAMEGAYWTDRETTGSISLHRADR